MLDTAPIWVDENDSIGSVRGILIVVNKGAKASRKRLIIALAPLSFINNEDSNDY